MRPRSTPDKRMKILITGGAGFIGSHLADHLIKRGYAVRVLDNLDPQVHRRKTWPSYLSQKAERMLGDVCNRDQLKKALREAEDFFEEASRHLVQRGLLR